MFDTFIRVFSSVLAHTSAVVFIYAMFRIEIKNNHKQIAILSLVMGSVYYVMRFGFETKLFFPITAMVLVLGIMVMRNYPFYYAFIIGCFGYFIAGMLDEVITFGLMSGMNITLQDLLDSTFLYVLSQCLVIIFLLGISVLFVRQKWGFVFIYKRFRNKRWILKTHNFIWAFSMLAGMVIIQLSIISFNFFSFPWIFFIALIIGFVVALVITERENKKVYSDLKRIVKEGNDDFKIY